MNLIERLRSLLRNSKRVQGEISLTRRTIVVGSTCILLSGVGGGVVYKEWQSHSQGQIQINNCFFVPTPSATFLPKSIRKALTSPEAA